MAPPSRATAQDVAEETAKPAPVTSRKTGHKKTLTDQERILPRIIKFLKQAGFLVTVWIVGYFGFSVSWVVLGLFFYSASVEYKKIKDAKMQFALEAVTEEKDAILARTDELPSWVFFPDVERAEWLNKMIKQMWPYIGVYVKQLLKSSVEATVDSSMPSSLRPFKFEKIDLGHLPPRVGGVKTYVENVKRDEIIMDMELFYASDSNIKVAVRGLTAGIKDLQIHGTIRCVMSPLVTTMPIIGGMNVFFLNQPSVDFDMTDVANILDFPLLNETLRNVVQDQISYYMVLPNKIPIQLAANLDMARLKYPTPQGVLRLHMVAGRDLKAADFKAFGKGKSDPYCKIYVGAQSFKTKVISDTVNPVWDQYFEAVVEQKHGQFADVEVMDKDPGDDDELGTCSIDIQHVATEGSIDTWLPLENVSTGMIHVRGLWLHLSKDPQDLQREKSSRFVRRKESIRVSSKKPPANADNNAAMRHATLAAEEHLSSALLLVSLDSAKSLPKLTDISFLRSKKSMTEPSAYAKISIGNDEKKSITKAKTTDPKWEENFQFLVHDPKQQILELKLLDGAKNDKRLGTLTVPLKSLLSAPDMTVSRPYPLRESGPSSKVFLRLCLRVLTSETPEEWALDSDADLTLPTDASLLDGPDLNPDDLGQEQVKVELLSAVSATTESNHKDGRVSQSPASDTVPSRTESRETTSPSSSIRHRTVASNRSSTVVDLGRIQLTLRYSPQRGRFVCVVHRCEGLMACDDEGNSDPYVKLYLLPDKNHKKKTGTVKNNLNPVFDESFDWNISASDVPTCVLEVTVKNSTGVFSKEQKVMGIVRVDLSKFNLKASLTDWYDLEPEESVMSRSTTV